MLEIVGSALPLIARTFGDADLAGLAHLREEMVEAIKAYCRHVHHQRELAVACGDTQELAIAQALADGCTGLNAAYDTFRDRWVHRDAAGNWHEYRLSAIVMMKHVRDQVQRAEAVRTRELSQAA